MQLSQIPVFLNSLALQYLNQSKRVTLGQPSDLRLPSYKCHAGGRSRPQAGFHKALLTTRETVNLSNFPDSKHALPSVWANFISKYHGTAVWEART